MKFCVMAWALISIIYTLMFIAFGVSVYSLFQLGTWEIGKTDLFWMIAIAAGHLVLLLALIKPQFKKLALLLVAPVFLVLLVKFFYFVILGYFFVYKNGILINLIAIFILLCAYIFLYKKLFDAFVTKEFVFYFIVLAVAVFPFSYDYAAAAKALADSQQQSFQ